jgi:hypothetical protein
MIKYFRKIREDLLSSGKSKRYFQYALGEILLVILGILIALGINNWNTDRLLRNSAYQNMEALSQNIEDDLEQMQYLKFLMDSLIVYSDRLNNQFQGTSIVNEKTIYYLLELLLEKNFTVNSNAFDGLNRNGEFIALDK